MKKNYTKTTKTNPTVVAAAVAAVAAAAAVVAAAATVVGHGGGYCCCCGGTTAVGGGTTAAGGGTTAVGDGCYCRGDGTQDRGCGYFMWMDDLMLHISSSSGSSTPISSYPGTLTRPSYSPGTSKSAQNLGKAECSNCKFLAEKIKRLEAKIKILEGALEMERHPEKRTLKSAAILHELYNDMGKLGLE
ncbi:hypothetical protein Tco_0619370 [Tanacetum coccineum]